MTSGTQDDGSDAARPGVAVDVAPGIRLLRAPNPSPMTRTGTNSWILGRGRVAVIDPGPDMPAHLDALLRALAPGETVARILVTHAHRDHSGLAPALARETGAPIAAAGGVVARRRPVMARLAESGLIGGGEGIDAGFTPDIVLEDGDIVTGSGTGAGSIAAGADPGWTLRVLATPGHTADHLSFLCGDGAFTGDHVMGWASSLISPPDGDLAAFMESCARLRAETPRVLYPGHGGSVGQAIQRIDALTAHRRRRETELLRALDRHRGATPVELARAIYTDIDQALLPAAERNVLAHLVALTEAGRVVATPTLSAVAAFALASPEDSQTDAPETSGRPPPALL